MWYTWIELMMVRGHTDPEPNMEVSLWCWAFMALRGSFKTAITEGRAVMTTPRLAKAWQKNQRAATLLRCLLMGRMFWEEKRGLVRDSLWISGEHQGFRRLPQVQCDQRWTVLQEHTNCSSSVLKQAHRQTRTGQIRTCLGKDFATKRWHAGRFIRGTRRVWRHPPGVHFHTFCFNFLCVLFHVQPVEPSGAFHVDSSVLLLI